MALLWGGICGGVWRVVGIFVFGEPCCDVEFVRGLSYDGLIGHCDAWTGFWCRDGYVGVIWFVIGDDFGGLDDYCEVAVGGAGAASWLLALVVCRRDYWGCVFGTR